MSLQYLRKLKEHQVPFAWHDAQMAFPKVPSFFTIRIIEAVQSLLLEILKLRHQKLHRTTGFHAIIASHLLTIMVVSIASC